MSFDSGIRIIVIKYLNRHIRRNLFTNSCFLLRWKKLDPMLYFTRKKQTKQNTAKKGTFGDLTLLNKSISHNKNIAV